MDLQDEEIKLLRDHGKGPPIIVLFSDNIDDCTTNPGSIPGIPAGLLA